MRGKKEWFCDIMFFKRSICLFLGICLPVKCIILCYDKTKRIRKINTKATHKIKKKKSISKKSQIGNLGYSSLKQIALGWRGIVEFYTYVGKLYKKKKTKCKNNKIKKLKPNNRQKKKVKKKRKKNETHQLKLSPRKNRPEIIWSKVT